MNLSEMCIRDRAHDVDIVVLADQLLEPRLQKLLSLVKRLVTPQQIVAGHHEVGGGPALKMCIRDSGEGLLVRLAAHLRDEGKSAVQIAATLEHAKEHLHLVAAIDDLKYLRKGGRLPAAVAVAGGMLGIKPLITIKEGKVAMAGKARGLPGAYVALFKKIEELGGVNPRFPSLAGYTISTREVNPIQTYLVDNLGLSEPLVRQIGCVIGTHAGPGAFGLAFFDNGLVID